MPCGACGYTDLVLSSVPPAQMAQAGLRHWGPALGVCVVVSALVFGWALLTARYASDQRESPYGARFLHVPQQSHPAHHPKANVTPTAVANEPMPALVTEGTSVLASERTQLSVAP